MNVSIKKWGNSYGIKLPKSVINELKLKENDILDLSISNGKIIIKKNCFDELNIREIAESYYGKPFNELMSIEKENTYDWGIPRGNEVW